MELTKKRFSFRRNIDMTKGGIVSNILKFAFPLLLGNLFQQLYNMVDTWVVGQTGNSGAYAAVGSIGPVINVLIGFFSAFPAVQALSFRNITAPRMKNGQTMWYIPPSP